MNYTIDTETAAEIDNSKLTLDHNVDVTNESKVI